MSINDEDEYEGSRTQEQVSHLMSIFHIFDLIPAHMDALELFLHSFFYGINDIDDQEEMMKRFHKQHRKLRELYVSIAAETFLNMTDKERENIIDAYEYGTARDCDIVFTKIYHLIYSKIIASFESVTATIQ